MALGLFFDPLALLRLSPLVTSSFSLWFSVDQYTFYSSLITPANRAKGSEMLPLLWKSWLRTGLSCIFGLYGCSIAAGVANSGLYSFTSGSSPPLARWWYGLGTVLAACHFLFVPAVAPRIRAMIDDESRGESWRDQKRWLDFHVIRSLVVDLPSWACFLVAATKGLKAI